MAVFTRGMTPEEVANLTAAMVSHSDKLRWNDQQWAKSVVDKHSTGGVGDKTSHILAPMIAACGGKVRRKEQPSQFFCPFSQSCNTFAVAFKGSNDQRSRIGCHRWYN